jgi:2'-5' RNA ligase
MKTFLAVEVPPQVRTTIQEQIASIQKDYPDFNWVPLENYHITLFYIGEVNPEKIHHIVEHVEKTIFDIEPTHMFSLGSDLYIHKTIIPYISFQRNKTIMDLNKRFVELFEDKKLQKYMPHLTVARAKIPSKQQYFHLKKKLQNLKVEFDFPVKEIHLYESKSMPRNPVYTKLHTFQLIP